MYKASITLHTADGEVKVTVKIVADGMASAIIHARQHVILLQMAYNKPDVPVITSNFSVWKV